MTTQSHNLDSTSKKSLSEDILRISSKRKAIENVHEKPNIIINS